MYHVVLALTESQVKRLKGLALARDLSVKDLVTTIVTQELDKANKATKGSKAT